MYVASTVQKTIKFGVLLSTFLVNAGVSVTSLCWNV